MDGTDWRSQLEPEARSRIVNEIIETLKMHLPVPEPQGLNELQKIAVLFEEKIYTAATSQSDYLGEVSLKTLSMATKTQQDLGNAQVFPNVNAPGSASVDSKAQSGHAGAGDWQEEIYQMIKSLKDNYFAELSELYNKISTKLHQVDTILPNQKPTDQYERMKNFKVMLERILQVLQINKTSIQLQPSLWDKIPQYEKQIISILNSQRRRPVSVQQQAFVESMAQTGHAGADDWRDEICQMVKSLKDQYFAELSELYNKVSSKLQQVDTMHPNQKPTEQYERMKNLKVLLERILQVLQINKTSIQLRPFLWDKIPQYEKQIISILNSQRRRPVQQQGQQQFHPAGVQAPGSYISSTQRSAFHSRFAL